MSFENHGRGEGGRGGGGGGVKASCLVCHPGKHNMHVHVHRPQYFIVGKQVKLTSRFLIRHSRGVDDQVTPRFFLHP